jgi:cysteine desulfurase
MKPYAEKIFGNPASFHAPGKEAADAVAAARKTVAVILNCRSEEIVFTSGGTEADNLAVLGIARANREHGQHIVTAKSEHPAVLEAAKQLEKEGWNVTYLTPDQDGIITAKQVAEAIRPDTVLVSLMYANNEIGTITPIDEIGNMIGKKRQETGATYPIFHTDACQAAGYLDLDAEKLHVDAMTINGSKIYGPKGAGALFLRRGIKIQPLMYGGHQQSGRRPGTENVAGSVGLAEALKIASIKKDQETKRLIVLRDRLIDGVLTKIKETKLNGPRSQRLSNNANISFLGAEGEALVLYLDAQGVAVATGSACTSASLDPSHVLLAIGVPEEAAHCSLRLSLGRQTKKKDIDRVLKILPGIVERVRGMSALTLKK